MGSLQSTHGGTRNVPSAFVGQPHGAAKSRDFASAPCCHPQRQVGRGVGRAGFAEVREDALEVVDGFDDLAATRDVQQSGVPSRKNVCVYPAVLTQLEVPPKRTVQLFPDGAKPALPVGRVQIARWLRTLGG